MEHVIPQPILHWLISLPLQTWVWVNFIAIIWMIGGVVVSIVRGYWCLEKYRWRLVPSVASSLLFALGWPFIALFYLGVGILFMFFAILGAGPGFWW